MTNIERPGLGQPADIPEPNLFLSPQILEGLKQWRSCVVKLANTRQYNQLTADMQSLLLPSESDDSPEADEPNVLTLMSSGLLHSRPHKWTVQQRLAERLEAFAPAEPEDDRNVSRLIIIKGLYGTRRYRGNGVPGLIQSLAERINQPGQPMLLAMTMHRWEVPPVASDEIGTPQSLIRAIALGISLDDSGRLAGGVSEQPYIADPRPSREVSPVEDLKAEQPPLRPPKRGFIGTFSDPRIGLSKEDDII